MKKIILFVALISLVCSCSVFRRNPKVGCPTSGAAIGAEKILGGDRKAIKASSKSKFKGN